jgi:sulfide:quinone oxidoreductase
VPIPPSPDASQALLAEFAERGIDWHPNTLVRSLDPGRKVAQLSDDTEMRFDLLLAVPTHRVPAVVVESGLAVDGWIPVDPLSLQTAFADVYAIGDVASVGTPKAGVFAEGQAAVVAERIVALLAGQPQEAHYGGRGTCYVEFGSHRVGRVDVTFLPGERPAGTFDAPSLELTRDKVLFGRSRAQRWFGREWEPIEAS